jgi:hypothetical protein
MAGLSIRASVSTSTLCCPRAGGARSSATSRSSKPQKAPICSGAGRAYSTPPVRAPVGHRTARRPSPSPSWTAEGAGPASGVGRAPAQVEGTMVTDTEVAPGSLATTR